MSKFTKSSISLAFLLVVLSTLSKVAESTKKVHYIHWNRANPMFRLDNTDHMIDVNVGNQAWEYDQVNLICPMSKVGGNRGLYPERHVIYSVSREEYDSCRITNPKPKIVAVCSQPHQLLYFTITFRSFTPTPGGLEFHPGQDYYFISTSSNEDLHRRVGGGCATHNMKMIFRVADNSLTNKPGQIEQDSNIFEDPRNNLVEMEEEITTKKISTEAPKKKYVNNGGPRFKYQKNPVNYRDIYYYHPSDLINEVDSNSIYQNNEALRYTSGARGLDFKETSLVDLN